ncbi:ATP-binding cassette domain-containing protein [Nesterenkonia alkaliphila]|uniref:ATP-binding cassette domain-containing protein n=1 Tax=Nesterenkonia alkaliphila TaxID=1463631 RepID=A0A7K1UF26_9MICC|nr:ABC transporter ATP-binding protein [Nesterenkonia alkaliphila]MVT25049.1 ATP-binding cassette domain-containing protein [Nesterenkonia alkaliphila]
MRFPGFFGGVTRRKSAGDWSEISSLNYGHKSSLCTRGVPWVGAVCFARKQRRRPAVSVGIQGSTLEVKGVGKSYEVVRDSKVPPVLTEVLQPVDVLARPGELVSIVGPSGCGKSTLFSIVAGLEAPSVGTIEIDGADVTGTTGHVGYMLQKDMLLPWRSILDNVILGLEVRGVARADALAAARPLLKEYGLGDYEAARPAQLSGGMRQRAALLRTLLFNRPIMLLDEPFGALDAQTRLQMQIWLLEVQATFMKSIVFVTHDIDEAVLLSDRIYVMWGRPGSVVQEIEIDLPKPRGVEVTTTPAFAEYKEQVRSILMRKKEEVSL